LCFKSIKLFLDVPIGVVGPTVIFAVNVPFREMLLQIFSELVREAAFVNVNLEKITVTRKERSVCRTNST
tara:strand:+ start:119406 stop:119615 length:210 start_codon:yes stop_codon:yes gene_type:complete